MKRQLPSGLVIATLFGEEVATKECNTCKKVKYKHEFYVESCSKRKNKEQVRNQCIHCWERFKGDKFFGIKMLKIESELKAMENA